MPHLTFSAPDLTTFCDLDDLGLVVVGQHRSPERTVLECRVAGPDPWCGRCGAEGTPRDTVTRRLAHVPVGHRPTTLLVRVRRYKCTGCGRVWRQDTAAAAEPGAKLSRGGMRWALEAVVVNARLEALFAISEHVEVEATWGIYQRMIAAYREPDRSLGKKAMQAVIDALASGVPAALVELRKLGRTLKQRAADVLAFFDLPGTSNGPTEAINGRLEHLRGTALGFRNLTHYLTRSLLEAGGFRPRLHP
ncbi:transposase [Streptomyces sp. MAR4 CNY-716]